MTNRDDMNLTRRDVIRRGGLAAAGTVLLRGVGSAQAEHKVQPVCCGDQPLPKDSVFVTLCNDDSAKKYEKGDSPVVYRLGALWLMLATENWPDYFRNPKNANTEDAWLAGLAEEFKVNVQDVRTMWEVSKTKADSFNDIRNSWQNLTSNTGIYGARPCLGGQSLLNIACLAKDDFRTKPMLKRLVSK
jgi:hypothetical protein